MTVVGEASDHAIAFDRGGALAVATRLPVGLARRGGWGDTVLLRHSGPVGRRPHRPPLRRARACAWPTFCPHTPWLCSRPRRNRDRGLGAFRRARAAAAAGGGPDAELERADGGWWRADLTLADGEEYGFVLGDADAVRPDPRSRRQPRGVHELSAHFDHTAFAWTDSAWTGRQLAGGLIYELHIGTFTPEGTLDAAIGRLDHLVDLGVTHVELLPVNGFNGQWNWGYDGVLWYTVHEAYGGPAAYQRFVDAAPRGAGSPSCRTSSTTTSGRAATTFPSSVRTFATRAATRGASASISTRPPSARTSSRTP